MNSIRSILDKIELAQDPNTCPEVLGELADDGDFLVRSNVAENPNCTIKVLEKLAADEDWYTRCIVAQNPNCPEYIKKFIEAKNYMEKHYEQV